MTGELEEKLGRIRRLLAQSGKEAALFTSAGNISWLLGGGDPLVALTDPPVLQLLVTAGEVRAFSSEVERDRLEAEVLPEGVTVSYVPWEEPESLETAWTAHADPGATLADAPVAGATRHDFWYSRVPLVPQEIERYRALCSDAAAAVGGVVRGLEPGLTEHDIASRVAAALRERAIQPIVLLVGGDARLKRFRHPLPGPDPVQDRVMVVVCGRRHGLFANLTRLAAFTPLGPQEEHLYRSLLEIEAETFGAARPGRFFREVFGTLQEAYARHGHPNAWKHHHQGGPTGYYTRDFVVGATEERRVSDGSAYAWNPSLPGLKVEDTVLLSHHELEVLTVDPDWPTTAVEGIQRPDVLLLG